ncbi:MAG: malto-oligosyltrehalose trehalohydrolase [Acidimicrobiia bacterium]|nr:malto-oligosyltrehalose trehalohydrolase [Acidimicrobiia bacterium]
MTSTARRDRLGATVLGDGATTRFEVWAPSATTVDVWLGADGSRRVPMSVLDDVAGTWAVDVDGVADGERYRYCLDDGDALADPASRRQPDGVHGASAVIDTARFGWHDDEWRGIALDDAVVYELHVGTFTAEGTLDGVIGQLGRLAALGVTAIELMPVNAFPGERNWGYDGVFVSAVQESYGGPAGLARLVDAAHAAGLAVMLDVVYNHLGPEGNVLARYAPYFTDVYVTPWGDAVNVDGPGSDVVRRTFVESATGWIRDFHVDGLRLDAVGFIVDRTTRTFLEDLTVAVHAAGAAAGRSVVVIAESADNDPRLITPVAEGGVGCDASWNDDLHHSLRTTLLGPQRGYFEDYRGIDDLAAALARGWVFNGRYSRFRGRSHGRPLDRDGTGHRQLVVCSMNHDQVGNTPAGERPRLSHSQRLVAAATVLLSPYTPMLFMGEEYGETAPFPFFIDHGDPALVEATRTGRLAEFAGAGWDGDVADPADPATFARAVLDPSLADAEPHRSLLAAHTEMLSLRREIAALTDPAASHEVRLEGRVITVARTLGDEHVVLTLAFDADPEVHGEPGAPDAETAPRFDTRAAEWNLDHDADRTPWWATVRVS